MAAESSKSTWSTWVIIAFISVQVALPLSYYLGTDSFDERFAWRMFSPVRMARCEVRIFDASNGEPERINLGRELHIVWINLLKRARPAVIEAAQERFCRQAAETSATPDIRMTLSCTPPDSVLLGICLDRRDRDGDGVPDGYARSRVCDEPATCFATDCPDGDASRCYRERCRLDVVPRNQNLCEGRT